MPNQTSPNDVDNARPATMSAPEIITSKLLALVVRALTIPLGITTIVFAAIDMSAETTPYLPFLISVCALQTSSPRFCRHGLQANNHTARHFTHLQHGRWMYDYTRALEISVTDYQDIIAAISDDARLQGWAAMEGPLRHLYRYLFDGDVWWTDDIQRFAGTDHGSTSSSSRSRESPCGTVPWYYGQVIFISMPMQHKRY